MERKQLEVEYLADRRNKLSDEDGERMQVSNKKPTAPPPIVEDKTQEHDLSDLLKVDKENILRGIIFSEVFGSPLARRRR
mgnify:CR=1 FL=1